MITEVYINNYTGATHVFYSSDRTATYSRGKAPKSVRKWLAKTGKLAYTQRRDSGELVRVRYAAVLESFDPADHTIMPDEILIDNGSQIEYSYDSLGPNGYHITEYFSRRS